MLGVLGAKLYGTYDRASGLFTKTHGTIFGAREVTASLQGIDNKTPIVGGKPSPFHVPVPENEL